MTLPWDDLKICFALRTNPDRLWRAFEEGRLHLPNGWELNETDISGASGYVAVFRVSVHPTNEDAYKVKAQLRRFDR
jgi:hypothetical protein